MVDPIRTLASVVTLRGFGLHTGRDAEVRLGPGEPGTGFVFLRVDLDGKPEVPARPWFVSDTTRATTLEKGEASVRTVEHLVAALVGMDIFDARIEIDGPEVPILDGSARPFAEAITRASKDAPNPIPPRPALDEPIWIPAGESFVAAIPSPELRFSCGISFDTPAIGEQWQSFLPCPARFLEEIAPARTFCRLSEALALRAQGLVQGGSLEGALVCDDEKWLNGPLRFPNEPARHKLLDWMGDLGLVGAALPRAHYIAFRAGHAMHLKMAKRLAGLP